MKRPLLFASAFGLLALLALAAYLPHTTVALLEPAGPVAEENLHVILVTLALCSIVVVPVFALLFYFAWRYRADRPGGNMPHEPNWDHDNVWAEFIWWLVPTIIIGFLAVLAWRSTHEWDPYQALPGEGQALEVQVVALDWKWLFIYPKEGVASVNVLEIPENTPVHFTLTADAPMNSFWIPQLGSQIMVMPGMTTQLSLEATMLGDFQGFSANISGAGFSGMNFVARAVPKGEFDAWVAAARASSSTLSLSAYRALARPSSYDAPALYSLAAPDLYTSIIDTYMTTEGGMQGMRMTP